MVEPLWQLDQKRLHAIVVWWGQECSKSPEFPFCLRGVEAEAVSMSAIQPCNATELVDSTLKTFS